MIICSKHEGNGTYREFLLDDADLSAEIRVQTHLARRSEDEVVAEGDWTEAGVITRGPDGLKAAVRRPSGKRGFEQIDKLFANEIAALQAIAQSFDAAALQN